MRSASEFVSIAVVEGFAGFGETSMDSFGGEYVVGGGMVEIGEALLFRTAGEW